MDIGSFTEHKSKILNIVLILIVLAVSSNIYKKQQKVIESLKLAKEQEIKKSGVLNEIVKLNREIRLYKDFVNKKDISSIVNRLGNLADESKVKIVSIKPGQEENFPIYIKYQFQMTVNVDSYHNIGKFISKLENSPDIYFIESVKINPLAGGHQDTSEENPRSNLSLDLSFSTVLLK